MRRKSEEYNGSQFFIVQKSNLEPDWINVLKNSDPKLFPKEVVEKYEQIAGTPWLDYEHTVFGKVFQGMDIVDDIANVKTTTNDKPVETIVIKSIKLTYYKK